MARKVYPDECPLFEVVDDGPAIRKGAIVEGLGLGARFKEDGSEGEDDAERIGVAVETADAFQSAIRRSGRFGRAVYRRLGYWHCNVMPSGLRPLTPAAVAMLALVRE